MDRDDTEAPLRVDIGCRGLTLPSMLVRISLLVLLAVVLTTGRATAGDVVDDRQAELAELEMSDAVLVRVIELAAPPASPAPIFVRGTEVEPCAPVVGRVFRPPRVAFA